MTPAIEAIGVTRSLTGEVPVTLVRDIHMSAQPGEFVAIIGPSGSGKSSLLYLLGLLDRPTAGRILVGGQDTGPLNGEQLSRLRLEKLGFVFQFHFLLPEFSSLDNVLIPMRKRAALADKPMRERAETLLVQLGLQDHLKKRPDQLSGGQRQRVAIARALANDPTILLADEPTGNLDTKTALVAFEIFKDLAHKEGRTVLVVTHDNDLATMADRRIHLVDGRVTEE